MFHDLKLADVIMRRCVNYIREFLSKPCCIAFHEENAYKGKRGNKFNLHCNL